MNCEKRERLEKYFPNLYTGKQISLRKDLSLRVEDMEKKTGLRFDEIVNHALSEFVQKNDGKYGQEQNLVWEMAKKITQKEENPQKKCKFIFPQRPSLLVEDLIKYIEGLDKEIIGSVDFNCKEKIDIDSNIFYRISKLSHFNGCVVENKSKFAVYSEKYLKCLKSIKDDVFVGYAPPSFYIFIEDDLLKINSVSLSFKKFYENVLNFTSNRMSPQDVTKCAGVCEMNFWRKFLAMLRNSSDKKTKRKTHYSKKEILKFLDEIKEKKHLVYK